MKQNPNNYYAYEAIWGHFALDGCYLITELVVRGDNLHPYPC